MRASRIFVGVLLMLLGLGLALANFGYLQLNWHMILKFWPLLLVLAGISFLIPQPRLRWIIVGITGLLIMIWLVAVFAIGWNTFSQIFPRHHNKVTQVLTENLSKQIRSATLTLNSGAGRFSLSSGDTDKLVEAVATTDIGQYTMNKEQRGDHEEITLELQNGNHGFSWGHKENSLDMSVNPGVIWNLDLNVGASSVILDMSNILVKEAKIDAGASSIKIKMGKKSDTTDLKIEAGASSIEVQYPHFSGVQILDHAELSSKHLGNFVKVGEHLYQSEDFSTAKNKIFVTLDAGVSSIRFKEY
ncbi:MAG: LiaI-LiaF-like domain-containing protein [Candidatus Kryptoniota bacterium]